jgi:hypothetical protein
VRGMRQLKKFALVLWIRKTDAFKAVRQQLVSIAEDDPDESTEFGGMVDFQWGSIRTRRPNGWRIRSKRFRTNQKSSSCVCPYDVCPVPSKTRSTARSHAPHSHPDPISIRGSFPESLQLRRTAQAPPARRIFSQIASAAAREGAGART